MKFSLDGLKNANWKQLAADHAEKVGLVLAVLIAAVLMYGAEWSTYQAKEPGAVRTEVRDKEDLLGKSVLTAARLEQDVPDFDVLLAADEVRKPLEREQIAWPKPMTAPLYPLEQPGGEPTWLPVEDLRTDYLALPVRLIPAADPDAAGVGDPALDPADPPAGGDFQIDGGGADLFNFGGGSPFADDDDEGGGGPTAFGGDDDEEGGFGGAVPSDARGRGVKMVAIRGVFPYRKQVQAMAAAMNVPFAEAEAQLLILGMEIQRQRASAGPNPWGGEWEPVDRDAAQALLDEDLYGATGQSVEVVSPALTDQSTVMPLPTAAYGDWGKRPEATHPRLKEFDLSSEDPALREKIEAMIRDRAEVIQQQDAAVGPEKEVFGAGRSRRAAVDQLARDAEAAAAENDPVADVLRRMTAADVLLLTRFFDVAVEPGQAYRYRIRLKVKNPNFGLGPADVSDPAALEGETRFTPWSDPSAPVVIPPDELAYLTTIYAHGGGRLPEARLEVTEYSREYGTLVSKDTRVDAGDLLVFEERNTRILDPFKQEKDEKATYPFVTDHVVIGVDALPNDAEAYHPDLNLGNRKLPPGRVLMLLDTGVVREIDAGLEPQRQAVAGSVQREWDGLSPQLKDRNAPEPEDDDDDRGFRFGGED